MRYFTLDDWIADQDHSASVTKPPGEAAAAYASYLASIRSQLPLDLQQLLATTCLHDAALRQLEVDVGARRVMLVLDAGTVDMTEPRRVRLIYEDALGLQTLSDPARALAGPRGYGDLGYDELEVLAPRTFEHRLLFSSGIELAVQFQDFRLGVLPDTVDITVAPQN